MNRTALGCALTGAAAVVTALVLAVTSTPTVVRGETAAPLPTRTGTLPTSGGVPDARHGDPPAPSVTARLRLPRLNLDARVARVRLVGRVMQVPRDPAVVGWWSGGAVPGAIEGSAVVVGHVDYAGTDGAFAVLPRARPGDVVTLSQPRLRFRVAAVRTYPKSAGLPQRIFARTGAAQLVLVTCGGAFDAESGNYRDNIVVYAQQQ